MVLAQKRKGYKPGLARIDKARARCSLCSSLRRVVIYRRLSPARAPSTPSASAIGGGLNRQRHRATRGRKGRYTTPSTRQVLILHAALLLLLLTSCVPLPSYEDSPYKRIRDLEEYSRLRYNRGWSDGLAVCEAEKKTILKSFSPPPGCVYVIPTPEPWLYQVCNSTDPRLYERVLSTRPERR